MLFSSLANTFQQLESTASRNDMTKMLSDLFKEASDSEVGKICYLSLGRLSPLYQRLDFNLADKMVIRALALAYKQDPQILKNMYLSLGDLGEMTYQLANQKQTDQSQDINQTFSTLKKIANLAGTGSQEAKIDMLGNLINQHTAQGAKYLVRIILGKLRLGFSDKTILDALSFMEAGDKSKREQLESAYQIFPDVGKLAQLIKKSGINNLAANVHVTLGVPIMPALCQRLKSADDMIKKMGSVFVEAKFDGTRVQIHVDKSPSLIRTFTRNLDENSDMFPELMNALDQIDAENVILDSEAVGYDPKTNQLVPFQTTITRKRKHGIQAAATSVPLKFFVFDVLFLNGQSLINQPLSKRRQILKQLIKPGQWLILDEALETKDPQAIRDFHAQKLKAGLEGAVIKKSQGPYIPGRRDWNWVKFKEVEATTGKLSDTLDCVVMGFYRGKGKRNRFGIGAFLVGIRNKEALQTIAKIGTGLTDEQWLELKKRLDPLISSQMPHNYQVPKALTPDVWVDPNVVVEIAADEITKSPIHTAGIALRFPRLVRFREDKSTNQATNLQEALEISAAS